MPFADFFQKLTVQIINPLITVFFGVALLVFIWGVIEFIAKSGNEEALSAGKKHMLWGIVGLAIMVGVWGIIKILQSLF